MEKTIRDFIENPTENSDDCSNFFDWFCHDEKLEKRMLALLPKVKFLVAEGILNQDSSYVWFKNNCPMNGTLYDDIRISLNNDENTYLGGFCPRTGHDVEMKCSFWLIFEDDSKPMQYEEFKNWLEFKKEVKMNSAFKQMLVDHFNK